MTLLTDRMDNDQGWRDSRAGLPMSPAMVMISPAYAAGYLDEIREQMLDPTRRALFVAPYRGNIVRQLWDHLQAYHAAKAQAVCDNCGEPDPPLSDGDGRFCSVACAQAFKLR
jgi:hypothetical protein